MTNIVKMIQDKLTGNAITNKTHFFMCVVIVVVWSKASAKENNCCERKEIVFQARIDERKCVLNNYFTNPVSAANANVAIRWSY